jgi:hypothetical protein
VSDSATHKLPLFRCILTHSNIPVDSVDFSASPPEDHEGPKVKHGPLPAASPNYPLSCCATMLPHLQIVPAMSFESCRICKEVTSSWPKAYLQRYLHIAGVFFKFLSTKTQMVLNLPIPICTRVYLSFTARGVPLYSMRREVIHSDIEEVSSPYLI